MLEYGIKTITTNPTLITKADQIVKLVDYKTKKTRAYVLPSSYEDIVEKLIKDEECKLWAKNKKALLKEKIANDEELMNKGVENIDDYLGEFQ